MRALPDPPDALLAEIAQQSSEATSPLLAPLVDVLRARFGHTLDAVILYGSCLHEDDVTKGLVDLYAIVTDYGAAYPERRLRWFNEWMPPNVFYVETEGEVTLRSKYAVLSRRHLAEGCSDWFHSYIWARFAQPARIIFARDASTADRVHRALATAVLRFLHESAAGAEPGAELTAAELWAMGLRGSYAAELRPESADRAAYLIERNLDAYRRLAAAAAPALEGVLGPGRGGAFEARATERLSARARRAWWIRRWQGRALSLLRLSKALFTFENGVDYLAWKIERHTGHRMRVTPRLRRYPLIFAWGEIWRLLRSGALR